ncbi:nucleoid-associated protein YgaU [Streptomyces ambofaciens]
MSRRVSLPGADELFRTTGGMALQASTPRRPAGGEARVPAPAGESDQAAAEDAPQSVPAQAGDGEGAEHAAADAEPGSAGETHTRGTERSARASGPGTGAQEGSGADRPRKRGRAAARRPSGRERHDEKITVYVSAEELMDLEHARLVLRGEHGLAVDRGRIVREAVAVVLADLETRGDASILVRRLRGR